MYICSGGRAERKASESNLIKLIVKTCTIKAIKLH